MLDPYVTSQPRARSNGPAKNEGEMQYANTGIAIVNDPRMVNQKNATTIETTPKSAP